MKVAHRGALALVVGAVCVLASASIAQAVIQVQRGISGVTLKMTPVQVRAALGKPAKVRHGTNPFGPFTQYRYRGGLTVTFQGNASVTAVAVAGRTDRTASGVGVGSTEKAVKHGVHGVRCDSGNHPGGVTSCHVGSFKPGHRVTDFLLHGGRVVRVTVGFVID